MEKMFNEFGFQGTSSSKKIEFDRVKFEKEPAKHVIDVCVSQMFYDKRNMTKENLNFSHTEKINCGKNVNILMESFNDQNFNESLKEFIRLSIAQHAKNILNVNGMKFCLDPVLYYQGKICFRVTAIFDGVTEVTIVFKLIESPDGETCVTCNIRSEQIVCCCC